MYFQIESVLEKYDLNNCIVTKGRQVLLCEKDHKLYALKEYAGSEKKAGFLWELGQFLLREGWETDYLIKNADGALITEGVDGMKYTLHHWCKGRECDVKSRSDILCAAAGLGRFHRVCQSFCPSTEAAWKEETPGQEYLRHTKELKKIYQFIVKRKKKSPFESLFIQCFHDFYRQCKGICEEIQGRNWSESACVRYVCHGDFNHHNVILFGGKLVFLHFFKAGYGIQIFDLCNFMRKIMEKYGWDQRLGMAMLDAYHRENPLDEDSFWQLYYRIAFPEKFWKLANRYYVSNKAWISRQNYEKLSVEIRQNKQRLAYLERMLYFYENNLLKNDNHK